MANTKSAKKRMQQNEKRRVRNQGVKTRMKTFIKRTEAALDAKDIDAVKQSLPAALAEIDRATSKGVIHRNNAARKKSSLQRRAATLD